MRKIRLVDDEIQKVDINFTRQIILKEIPMLRIYWLHLCLPMHNSFLQCGMFSLFRKKSTQACNYRKHLPVAFWEWQNLFSFRNVLAIFLTFYIKWHFHFFSYLSDNLINGIQNPDLGFLAIFIWWNCELDSAWVNVLPVCNFRFIGMDGIQLDLGERVCMNKVCIKFNLD